MDAVLLTGFARVNEGETCVDLGTGTGIIPLLLSAKTEGKHFIGVEIQKESADMAARSVALNDLEERISVLEADLLEAPTLLGKGKYNVVTGNPPYMTGSHGLVNPESAKAIARHEIACTLDGFVGAAASLLKPAGRFYMVHRPFRLPEIFASLSGHGLEPKRMQLVYPAVDKEPSMVLIESVRGGRPRIKVEPPLIIYGDDGKYTSQIYDIYGY